MLFLKAACLLTISVIASFAGLYGGMIAFALIHCR